MKDQSAPTPFASIGALDLNRRRLLKSGALFAGATMLGPRLGRSFASAQEASPVPQPGGTLVMGFEANPDDLNPFTMSSLVSALVVGQVYDYLFEFDSSLTAQPSLCTSYETPDDTTYVFHIAENAMFSDGTPLTSEDVKFTLESYKVLSSAHAPGRRGSIRSRRSMSTRCRSNSPSRSPR